MENRVNIEKKDYVQTYVKKSFNSFKEHWKVLIPSILIFYALMFIGDMVLSKQGFLGMLVYQLGSIFISIGITRLFLSVADNKKPSIGLIFKGTTAKQFFTVLGIVIICILCGFILASLIGITGFATMIMGNLLMASILVLLLIFLITILVIAISFYMYAIIDKDKGIISSLSYSWAITKGVRFKLFVLGVVSIFIIILGLIALGVGLFVAIPIVSVMQAHIYRDLSNTKGDMLQTDSDLDTEKEKEVVSEVLETTPDASSTTSVQD